MDAATGGAREDDSIDISPEIHAHLSASALSGGRRDPAANRRGRGRIGAAAQRESAGAHLGATAHSALHSAVDGRLALYAQRAALARGHIGGQAVPTVA